MISAEGSRVVKFVDNLRISTHGEGAAILNIDDGTIFNTNIVGARIIAMITAGTDIDGMAKRLAEDFDADPGHIRSDINAFIMTLRERNLLIL